MSDLFLQDIRKQARGLKGLADQALAQVGARPPFKASTRGIDARIHLV